MYFKTAKDSETGKKLADVYQKGREAWEARSKLIEELMKKYPQMTGRFMDPGGLVVWGGIFSIEFSEEPDDSVWIKVEEKMYMPMETTEEGEEVCKKVYELPVVKYTDINACLHYNNNKNRIGFRVGEKNFGLEWAPDWEVKTPADCVEILHSEYEKL